MKKNIAAAVDLLTFLTAVHKLVDVMCIKQSDATVYCNAELGQKNMKLGEIMTG